MSQDAPYTRTERYETIIIGGGQAGLAAACELQERDLDYLVLDPGMVLPAAYFDLALRLGVSVRSLRRAGGRFEILAGALRYEATSVIVATGPSQAPLDLRSVEGEPGLYLLGGITPGRDAARIAERIAERIAAAEL